MTSLARSILIACAPAVLVLSQAAGAWASTLDRPIFTADRNFVIEAPATIDAVQDDSLPVTLAVFEDARKSCALNLDDVHGRFALLLAPTSAVWGTLDLIFPGSLARVRAKGIHVVIDDFSQYAGNNPEYASYFVHDGDGPVIGLDCSTAVARSYWLPSLAHELTHAILDGQGDESWWEEALAQQMEREVGGVQPELSAGNLAQSASLPSLLDPRRPLPSHESYGIAYLFGKYLRQELGGWATLQAMAEPAAQASDFLAQIAQQGQALLKAPGALATSSDLGGLGAEKLTRDGLLRYFYVALTMNNPAIPEYSITGWEGLKQIPETAPQQELQPGQAAVFQDVQQLARVNPELESYEVRTDAKNGFRIIPYDHGKPLENPSGFQAARDYALVLNLTAIERPLLQ